MYTRAHTQPNFAERSDIKSTSQQSITKIFYQIKIAKTFKKLHFLFKGSKQTKKKTIPDKKIRIFHLFQSKHTLHLLNNVHVP